MKALFSGFPSGCLFSIKHLFWRDTLLFNGDISVILATNIHHMSWNSREGFQCRRSKFKVVWTLFIMECLWMHYLVVVLSLTCCNHNTLTLSAQWCHMATLRSVQGHTGLNFNLLIFEHWQMTKIKNSGLDQYDIEPFEQQQFGPDGVERVKDDKPGRLLSMIFALEFDWASIMNVMYCCWICFVLVNGIDLSAPFLLSVFYIRYCAQTVAFVLWKCITEMTVAVL